MDRFLSERTAMGQKTDLVPVSAEIPRLFKLILSTLHSKTGAKPLTDGLVDIIKRYVGCTAVGVRLLQADGMLPYCSTQGFSSEFLELEDDVSLEGDSCMCSLLMRKGIDPENSHLTESGSVVLQNTSDHYETAPVEERLGLRGHCHQCGYASVALIPISAGEKTIGLIHLASASEDDMDSEKVTVVEDLALFIGPIIERAQASDRLEENHKLISEIVSNLPVSVYWKDLNHRYLGCNHVFAARVGSDSPEHLIGKTDAEIGIPKSDVDSVRAIELAVVRSGESDFDREEKNDLPDGSEATLLSSRVPLTDAEGRVCGVIGISSEITHRKTAELALRESEKKYRALVESLSEGIWSVNKDALTTHVNPRMAEMLGYSVDEMIGKSLYSFVEPSALDICRRKLDLGRHGEKSTLDLELVRKDGASVFTISEASPLFDDHGEYLGAVAGVIDITQRRKTERALLESEMKYRKLVETMREGLAVRNASGRLLFVNSRLCDMLGYSRREMVGHSINEFLDEENQLILQGQWERRLRGELGSYELTWIGSSGNAVTTIIAPAPVIDRSGRLRGSFAIISDITERKKMEVRLRKTTEELKSEREALKEKNIALKQVLEHIAEEKEEFQRQMYIDVWGTIESHMNGFKNKKDPSISKKIAKLKKDVRSVLSNHMDPYSARYATLTPREVEICEMIVEGLTSKEISHRLNVSVLTIHKHREIIRKKMGIQNREINLSTYLRGR